MDRKLFDRYHESSGRGAVRRAEPLDQWGEHMIQPGDPALPDVRRASARSTRILYVLLAVITIAVVLRIGFLDIVRGSEFRDRSENNYIRRYVTRALRGVVYDRDGMLLVRNVPRNDAAVIPADLPRDTTARRRLFIALSELLAMPVLEIEKKVSANEFYYLPIVIKENIDHDATLALLSAYPENKDGVIVVEDFYREYLGGPAFSHILGYLGKVQPEDLRANPEIYNLNSEIGKTGFEYVYESKLKGNDGVKTVHINAQGKVVDILATSNPVAGCDVTLTINAALQQRVYDLISQTLTRTGTAAGIVVVLDPRDGSVLSMVSVPTYDNSIFSDGLTGDEITEFQELATNENKPFLNRAISGVYAPGSTYKLVTASAVLAEHVVSPDTRIEAPGSISIEHQYFPDKFFVYKDWNPAGHGLVNAIEALAESADTYFYKVAGGYQELGGLGVNRLKQYSLHFGLGRKLGIELPGEQGGTVPDDEWKRSHIGEGWYTGDTYNMAIGQGYLLATPLQVASFTSVIANGGTLYQPHIIKKAEKCSDASETDSMVLQRDVAPPSVIQAVQQGMRLSITGNRGTGKALRSYQVPVAGKTGTAQFNNNQSEHAWFTAYAPYDNPEVVVTALVEGGGEGGDTALPLVRQVLDAYFSSQR